MSDAVQEIKEKLSIVDVVGWYVKLTKAGKYWKGLSPFNKEKTPSFFVSPDRGFYHCFSSGKGGDIFTFIQEMEGLDFKGALRILAEKAGVQLVYESKEKSDERESVFAVLKSAEKFYSEVLDSRPDVHEYLKKRGLKSTTIEKFSIGYAPNEWRATSEYLLKKGYTEKCIADAGLTKKPDEAVVGKKSYDRLRGRIMFPIRDIAGRTVGFSGRIFEDDPKHPQAKYINSPETVVFHKSRTLYGLDMAREGIRKYNFALLVEGQVDLLMTHQIGFVNAVALSGTSFTDAHASLLKRYSDNLLIAFDGDAAGIAAAGRAAALALQAGLNVKIAHLPTGKDPADVITYNEQEFKVIIKNALHVIDFYLAHLGNLGYDDRTFKLEASRTVLPFLSLIQNAIDREYFTLRIAEALSVSVDSVMHELKKIQTREHVSNNQVFSESESSRVISRDPFLSRNDAIERLLSGIFLLCKEQGDEECYARVREALIQGIGETRTNALFTSSEEMRPSLIEAELYLAEYEDKDARLVIITDLINDFKKAAARRLYREKTAELKRRESASSPEETKKLLEEIATLAKDIK